MNKILFRIFLLCIILSITSYAQDNSKFNNAYNKLYALDYSGALMAFNNYIAEYPNDCRAYIARASSKEELNDYSGAYEDLVIFNKKADWRQDCDWRSAVGMMARLLLKMNQLPEALATFDQLFTLNLATQIDNGYYYRGITKYLLKDYKGAIADLNNVSTLHIKYFFFTLNTRGFAKFETYDYSGAQEDFEDHLSIIGPSAVAYYGRGLVKMRTDYKAAILDFNNAISIFPSVSFTGLWKTLFGDYFSLSYTYRAECKYMTGDHSGAIEDYNKAITLSPDYAPNYAGRGHARKNLVDGIQDFDKAIQLDPGNPNYYHYRSQLKYGIGDKDGACRDFRKARQLGLSATYHYLDKLCE
jgi:tetratricopeptide (TPR) repeat protein